MSLQLGRVASLALLALGLAGCPGSHDRDDDTRTTDGATPADDGGMVPALDSDVPVGFDASSWSTIDASLPPLPDDEPDVPPGSRPSDDPSHAPWGDPPDLGPDDDCCTHDADPGPIDDLDDALMDVGIPAIAWADTEWGIAWATGEGEGPYASLFRRMDAEARPTSPLRAVEGVLFPPAMAWGNHRFAILSSEARDGVRPALAILDRDGVVRSSTPLRAGLRVTDVIRHPAIHGWAIAASDTTEERPRTRWLMTSDGANVDEHAAGTTRGWYRGGTVVSMASRLVMVEGDQIDLTIQTFDEALALADTTRIEHGGTATGAAFRDTVVVVTRIGQSDGSLASWVYDPFAGELVSGPTDVLPSDRDAEFDVAGDDIGGTVGVCYGAYGVDRGEVRFVLLGPDGAQLGRSIRLARGYERPPNCRIAVAGPDHFVVAWSNSAWVVHHTIHATSVRVARPSP